MTSNLVTAEVGYRLAGFTDGEGHFAIPRLRKKATGNYTYGCVFIIVLRHDDRAVLERFHEITGAGTLYDIPRDRPGDLASPQTRWTVQKKGECLQLVEIFERYPLWSKKARDFEIWARAVRYLHGTRPEGNAPLARWHEEIKEIRRYVGPEKREVRGEPVVAASLFDGMGSG